jgi:hypothetical protein
MARRTVTDFGLDEPCQVSRRLLVIEITGLGWNDVRQDFLHDIQLSADRYLLQRHRHPNVAGWVGIVEFVRVAQAFARNEFRRGPVNEGLMVAFMPGVDEPDRVVEALEPPLARRRISGAAIEICCSSSSVIVARQSAPVGVFSG